MKVKFANNLVEDVKFFLKEQSDYVEVFRGIP